MKRRDVLFGCAVVLLSLGAPRAYTAQAPSIERATAALSDGNLLQDPSFEDTPLGPIGIADTPWGAEEPGAVEIVQGVGPAGPGAKFAQLTSAAQLYQVFAVEPSTDYRVSLWITGTPGAGAGGTARVHIADLSGIDEDADGDAGIDGSTALVTVSFDGETGAWRQVTFTFNSGAYARLHIRFNAELNPGESLWVDDVRITKNQNPTIRVTSPNGGEVWPAGSTHLITWTSSNLNPNGAIYIFYSANNGWPQIAGPLSPTTTSFSWTVPNTPTTSSYVSVGNWLGDHWDVLDGSDQSFTIQ